MKANQTTAEKGGLKSNETKRGGETGVKEKAEGGGEYLRHTECSVLKKVLLVRFEGSSPTIF